MRTKAYGSCRVAHTPQAFDTSGEYHGRSLIRGTIEALVDCERAMFERHPRSRIDFTCGRRGARATEREERDRAKLHGAGSAA